MIWIQLRVGNIYQGGDMGGMEEMNVGTGVADMDEQVEDMAYFNEKARG